MADGPPDLEVVEGRLLDVHDDVVVDVLADRRHHELRHRLLELLGLRLRGLAGIGHVDGARLQRGRARAALDDDDVLQPVEVRPALDEVVGVPDVLDELALAPFLELEGPRSHAARPVARRRDVGGVDGAVARGQHHEDRRLGALEVEDDRVRVGRLDLLDVGVPVLARVDAQLGRRVGALAHHVEGELHVLAGERLTVVPLHALAQEEDEVAVVVLPGPFLGEIADDRVERLHLLGRVVDDEVVEAGHRRPHGGAGLRLVDGESLRKVLPLGDVQGAAGFWRLTDGRRAERDDEDNAGDDERYRDAHAGHAIPPR